MIETGGWTRGTDSVVNGRRVRWGCLHCRCLVSLVCSEDLLLLWEACEAVFCASAALME